MHKYFKFVFGIKNFYLVRQKLIGARFRNRLPEKFIKFSTQAFLPYLGIIIIAFFTLTADYVKASGNDYTYNYSQDVMDLSPAEVAQTVSVVGSYTPNIKSDPVTVALAMSDTDFLSKPMVAGTQITPENKPATTPSVVKRTTTTTYTVQVGDTLSSIGWKFGLKIATIKYQNNLTSETLRPGQTLKLPAADISPDVVKKLAVKPKPRVNPGSSNNAYPYGWCTYYVATRRYVPGHWGNARSWLSSAKSAGYAIGSAPQAGAIVVLNESWMGHVAYVDSVNGNSITISEMNYRGWGVVDQRTISASGGKVMGYVY